MPRIKNLHVCASSGYNTGMNVILLRLLLSLLAGLLIGLERQIHLQPAGLKTHILISTGSTLIMIVSLLVSGGFTGSGAEAILFLASAQNGDPGRIAAQVVSGIGFLGGGAIIRQGMNIKGLTTAATIWVTAAIGLAIGLGAYLPAGITLGGAILTLVIMDQIELHFFPAKNVKTLLLVYKEEGFNYAKLEKELGELKILISNTDISKNLSSDRIRIVLQVHIPERTDIMQLPKLLAANGNLLKMELTSNERPSR
ncbi:MgtC/SapB family protein [Brucepastera parasyntrophica]|uniref:MgtC/SapB family protein n=1 Tax=Brucepastera parasyntrophica TaxID=2880008 RepID=UPI00210EBCB8|nr:MgtC/SapB family protein [Brucepastera parasyntrophica]ULQ60245.1 MgtC/SapB family protein [Brucepastera parasyntrophica]